MRNTDIEIIIDTIIILTDFHIINTCQCKHRRVGLLTNLDSYSKTRAIKLHKLGPKRYGG